MRRIIAMYKLARPTTSLSGAMAVILGGYVAGTGNWFNIILAAVATFLATGAANAWNDYLDVEIDRINQPHRVLPAGLMSLRGAWIFSIGLTIIALLIAAFINLPSFLIALVASVVLYFYSWKLKSTVLMGNATVATISALSAVFGGVAAGNVWPTFWLAIIIATAIMGREVLKTIADYEGDLRQRCRTIATVWGRRPARIVFYLLLGATVWMMMVPYLFNDYKPIYAQIVAIGVYPIILYVLIRTSRNSSGRQLERLSRLMKYDFFIWFIAVILGAAT
ncbi:MAG: geranylgeranylglycerol-phosphate geranylgeranyltransferase [Candidatus Promineifilaceae bacterium]